MVSPLGETKRNQEKPIVISVIFKLCLSKNFFKVNPLWIFGHCNFGFPRTKNNIALSFLLDFLLIFQNFFVSFSASSLKLLIHFKLKFTLRLRGISYAHQPFCRQQISHQLCNYLQQSSVWISLLLQSQRLEFYLQFL